MKQCTPEKKSNLDLIQKAYNHGATFFDTAEVYGPYVNEEPIRLERDS